MLEDHIVLCKVIHREIQFEVLSDGEMHVEHVVILLFAIRTVLHLPVENHFPLSLLDHTSGFVAALLASHQRKLHCSRRLVRVFGPHRLHAAFQLGDKRGATRVRKQRALFEKQSDAIRTGIEPDTNREQGGIRLFDNSQRERVLTPPNQVIRNIQQLDLVL